MTDAMAIFQAVGVIAGGLFFLAVANASQNALEDESNKTVVYIDQISDLMEAKGSGRWELIIYRQSGNYHSSWEANNSKALLTKILQTCKRANIDSVVLKQNTEDCFEIWRLFHNHRGRQEGKRIGGFRISRVES